MRSAKVLTPRNTRRLSNGPAPADSVLQKPQPIGQLVIVADNRDAADHIQMAVEVFSGRADDDAEPVVERSLLAYA
jgi:hypothetical protein